MQLLYRCDDRLPLSIGQLLAKAGDVICFVNVDRIIESIGLEVHGGLCVEVFPVNQEHRLFDGRDIHEQVPRHFVRCHCFARASRMPHKPRNAPLGSLPDRFDSMYLVWAQHYKFLLVLIQHSVFRYHLMRLWNLQHGLCKIKIICDWFVFRIQPATHELWVQIWRICSSKIPRIAGVADHEHLHC